MIIPTLFMQRSFNWHLSCQFIRLFAAGCSLLLLSACMQDGASTNESTSRINPSQSSIYSVNAWQAAPTDALITHPISGLTVRQAIAPHTTGPMIRIRLSNRYSSVPVTFDHVTVAKELSRGKPEMVAGTFGEFTFGGKTAVTIPAGATVISDWLSYSVVAFERVGISFYAPGFIPQLTRHLNANEFLYISTPGNFSAEPSGDSFQQSPDGYTGNFLVMEALEVAVPREFTTLVTVGDSITDGSDSTTGFKDGQPSPMTATDQRYPNHLQRRINQLGLPLSVSNAGIGGNELLKDGWLPQFGKALLTRYDTDVLAQPNVSHVLLMIGTNDFGNPHAGPTATADEMIEGFKSIIERTHRAGVKIVLGTIPPAEGTVWDGLPLLGQSPVKPGIMHGTAQARLSRDAVNTWIRQQSLSDGIVDFAACLEDPVKSGYIDERYNSGDNLHPNPAGYAALANCVDLQLFSTAPVAQP